MRKSKKTMGVGPVKKQKKDPLAKIGKEELGVRLHVPEGLVFVCTKEGCNFFSKQKSAAENHDIHPAPKSRALRIPILPPAKDLPSLRTLANDPKLKTFSLKIIEKIVSEIEVVSCTQSWDNIAGFHEQKTLIQDRVILPLLRPDLCTDLRKGETGVLLYGPPGTGKTMAAMTIAAESNLTFFKINASSIGSAYATESEQLVRCLFEIASIQSPSLIFIDEVDSILGKRDGKQLKHSLDVENEFLLHFGAHDKVLVVGATNRPHEMDAAAVRRFGTRLYVPLLEQQGRQGLIQLHLAKYPNELTDEDVYFIAERAAGFSGHDITYLCKRAVMFPITDLEAKERLTVKKNELRSIIVDDFVRAFRMVKPTVTNIDLQKVEEFDEQFGIIPELRRAMTIQQPECPHIYDNREDDTPQTPPPPLDIEDNVTVVQTVEKSVPTKKKKAYRRGLAVTVKEHLDLMEDPVDKAWWRCKFCYKVFSRTAGYQHADRRIRLNDCSSRTTRLLSPYDLL